MTKTIFIAIIEQEIANPKSGGLQLKKRIIVISVILVVFLVCSLIICRIACQNSNLGLFADKDYLEPLVQNINSAKTSIIVEMYSFTNHRPIISALKNAALRGVDVKLYVDNQDPNNPGKKNNKGELVGLPEKELESVGCKVKWQRTNKVMHRKVCIIDCQIVAMGSHNWTKNAFENNDEISRIFFDEEQACQLTEMFEKDWQQAVENYP